MIDGQNFDSKINLEMIRNGEIYINKNQVFKFLSKIGCNILKQSLGKMKSHKI